MAGLVPATHVFEEGCVDRREGVDDRDEPGQGDLELFSDRCKQPISVNRTVMGSARLSTAVFGRFFDDCDRVMARVARTVNMRGIRR